MSLLIKNRELGSWSKLKSGDLVSYDAYFSIQTNFGPGLVMEVKNNDPDHHLRGAIQVKVYFPKLEEWAWIDFYKLKLLSSAGE